MTIKDCGHQDEHRTKLHRRLFLVFISLLVTVLLVVLLVWLILRPTKPLFTLQDATVYSFNLTSPNLLTVMLQITLSSRNPNSRIGIYYDRLDVYTAYHSQQITLTTRLPVSYQGHDDITVWSPSMYGISVPVAPYMAEALEQDEGAGTVMVNIRVDGRVRWKMGTFISGKYHLYVNCPTYIYFGNKINYNKNNYNNNGDHNNGVYVGSGIKYQLSLDCNVDV